MRTEPFHEELEVDLAEDERNLRGRQAARLVVALEKHETKVKDEEKAWKDRKVELKDEGEKILAAQRAASAAAESGREKRQVACEEQLVGVMVVMVRKDTGETIDSRPASKDELRGAEKPAAKGYTAEGLTEKLAREIAMLCATGRTESLLKKALGKIPEAKASDIAAAIETALAKGVIVERDGKLVITGKPPEDTGIVDDDYKPGATH